MEVHNLNASKYIDPPDMFKFVRLVHKLYIDTPHHPHLTLFKHVVILQECFLIHIVCGFPKLNNLSVKRQVVRETRIKPLHKQECIPVGCIPPAAVATSPAKHIPLHHECVPLPCMPPLPHTHPFTTHAPLGQACPPPLPCMPPFAMHALLLPCTLPFTMHALLGHACPPTLSRTPPNRMTDASENITLPQLGCGS